MEILEDRTLLSTYTVNSLADTGAGSGLAGDLRYCITNATSGSDTITFGVTGTIQLQNQLPYQRASVDIQGPGASQVTVAVGYTSTLDGDTILNVGSAADVQISGLSFTGTLRSLYAGGMFVVETGGQLNLSDCTLSGSLGALANSGSAIVSACTISDNGGSGTTAAVAGLSNYGTMTISNSVLSGNVNYSGAQAAAISNTGNLTINNSTLAGNTGYDGAAGAIWNDGGEITINNSTLADNKSIGYSAGYSSGTLSGGGGGSFSSGSGTGGAIYMLAGTLSINSSTLEGNQASGGSGTNNIAFSGANGYGGGLYIANGTVSINNSTLADNQAIGGTGGIPGSGYGGGIYNAASPGALQMYDTILAGNSGNVTPDLDGGVTSLGHNLIGNSTGGSGFAASDLLNVNPQLGPLQNNGGPTQTMALLAGSPAINAGDNTNAPAYDQRGPGFPRIVGGTIDIGAFEVQNGGSTQASSLTVSGFPSTITAGSAGSFTVTALNADSTTDTNYTDTVHFSSSDGQASLPTDYTFTAADAGAHTFSATLKTAGTQSLTATDTTSANVTGSEAGISVNPAAASQLIFGQQPSITSAGQTISPAVTVDVEDQYGNVVSGDSSTVTLALSSGTFEGGSTTASTAASGGVAIFSTLVIDTAGSYTLMATDGGLTMASSGSFTVQAAASTLSVLGFPSPTTAGVAHNVTVMLKDAYGNIASGYSGTVHFTSSDAKATLPANYTFTAADAGVHVFSATLKTAGTQAITVTDSTTASLTSTDSGITVNPAAASKFILAAPASVKPGVTFKLTVTVEDAYGNVVAGYAGTIHFGSTDTRATLPANYTFTAADQGVHAFTGLVLRRKGNQKITVSDTHNSSLTGSAIVDVL